MLDWIQRSQDIIYIIRITEITLRIFPGKLFMGFHNISLFPLYCLLMSRSSLTRHDREKGSYVKRYPLTPTKLSLSSNHVFFLAGRWSTSGWGGNAHFFTYTRIRSRETGENRKTNEQTKLGVTKGRGRCCNTICMCRLSLAWVTSENSTMLLGSDILRLFFTGPYLVSSPLCSVSGVDCPSVDPRQLPLLLSNYQLCSPLGRVVNSHSPPRTTSGYSEISGPRILCLVSRQNRLVCFGGLPP